MQWTCNTGKYYYLCNTGPKESKKSKCVYMKTTEQSCTRVCTKKHDDMARRRIFNHMFNWFKGTSFGMTIHNMLGGKKSEESSSSEDRPDITAAGPIAACVTECEK